MIKGTCWPIVVAALAMGVVSFLLFAPSREVSAADLDGEIINIGPVGGNVGPPFEPGRSTTIFVRIRNTGTENAHFRVFVHSVSSRWSADDNCFDIFGTTCSVRDVEPGLEPFRTYTVGSPGDGGSGTIIWKLEVASAGCLILHLCDWTEVDTGVLSVFSGERATEFDLDEDPLLDVSGLVDPVGATGRALVIDIPQESGFKVNRNFEGLSAAEAGSDPPDPQIAVGPRHVVELLNNMGRIFTKNGRVVQTFYLGDFFNVPSVPSNGGRFFDHNFDPKIIYDARENRFFAIYSSRNEDADLGRRHIAVSITDDPTGTWRRWVMEFDGVFPDFPTIGLTNDKVTVSYNRNPLALTRFDTIFVDFDLATLLGILANYGGEQTVVFNKSQMLAPQGTTVRGAQFDSRITRVTMRPAHSLGSINDQYGVHLNPLSMLADTPVALLETVQLILEGVDPSLIAEYFLGQVGAILHQDKIVGVPGESEVKRVTRSLGIRFQQLPPPAIQKDTVHLLWPGASWLLDATYRNGTLTITGGGTYCKFGGDPLDRSCTHIIQLSPGENPSVTMDRYLGAGGSPSCTPPTVPTHRTTCTSSSGSPVPTGSPRSG